MATTTVHAQLIRYTTTGDQVVVNLKSTGSDVSIDRSTNTKLPTSVTSAQALADALGSLAFKNSLGKGDVGLGNVDNTADSAKSVKYATSAGSAANVTSGGVGSVDIGRHVWFSDSATETNRNHNDNFKYNPVTNMLTTNISGNAASASSVAWGNVTGKPSTFSPSSHGHSAATASASGFMSNTDKAKLDFGDIIYVSKSAPSRACMWVKLD